MKLHEKIILLGMAIRLVGEIIGLYENIKQIEEDEQMKEGVKNMKSFEGKLKELQSKVKNNEIEPIEWSQENTEVNDGKTTIIAKFKYEIPTPIKSKDLNLEDK